MTLILNRLLNPLLLFLFLTQSVSLQAQFWKKLKNKATEKLRKTEDKIINKLDTKSDKIIDSTLSGKNASKEKKSKLNDNIVYGKSYGKASINHSSTYSLLDIKNVTKTKVQKKGNQFTIYGNWVTTGIDVFDGYYIKIKNTTKEELEKGKTFSVPDEASFKISYDPLLGEMENRKELWEGAVDSLNIGSITVTYKMDESVNISFSGNATIRKLVEKENSITEEFNSIEKSIEINGFIRTTEPEYSILKVYASKSGINKGLSYSNTDALTNKRNPTTSIPGTFTFDKKLSIEVIDHRGESYPIDILLGTYPDIYGMQMAMKEMQGQGNITIINTPKSTTSFIDVAGMKMKKTTTLEELGDQYNVNDKLPDGSDFSYKKTGKAKNIAGYLCEEYKVDYNYVSNNGTASLWISKDFPIQNMQLPMLGMTLNNPYYSGFVMELSMNNNGRMNVVKVNNISNVSVNINSNQFRNMGF